MLLFFPDLVVTPMGTHTIQVMVPSMVELLSKILHHGDLEDNLHWVRITGRGLGEVPQMSHLYQVDLAILMRTLLVHPQHQQNLRRKDTGRGVV